MININFDNNKEYYDFDSLRESPYRFIIVNGIMDDGKTFGAKEDMLKRFEKFGERSIWIMNSRIMLDEELLKFKTANEEINANWNNYMIKNGTNGISTLISIATNEIVCYFLAISSVTKTARDDRIKNIYYDEFNYLDSRTYKLQISKFQMLLSRNMRVNKIFLIGNATSLNIPILFHFGIWEVPKGKDFFEFNIGNQKGLFHVFKRTIERIEKKYEDSLAYQVIKKTGFAEHAFKNEYNLDNKSKVDKDYLKKHKDKMILQQTFQIGLDIWVDFYSDINYKKFYIGIAKKGYKNRVKYFLDRDYMIDGLKYTPTITEKLARYFQMDRITYENIAIKQYFYEVIKPFVHTYFLK